MEDMVKLSPSFWRGRRVFLTGHTGFKGAWLWLMLQALGAEVSGIALPPHTQPSLFRLAGLESDRRSRFVDVRDEAAVRAELHAAQPEIVVHLAAQSLVHLSYEEPTLTFAVNVLGTVHVLNALRNLPSVRSIVIATSDKCYLNREWPWAYREDDVLGGYDPYSSSKACAELAVDSWRRSFFSNAGSGPGVASVRAGNVIGGGDWAPDRLIPDCVRAFEAGRAVEIRNPTAIRSWQHVLDPLAGYLLLAERLYADPARYGQAWNFGHAEFGCATVAAVVDRVASLWGNGVGWRPSRDSHPHEAAILRLDAAKARDRLGWRPQLNLDDSLEWTVEWYRRLATGDNAASMCLEQITRFWDRCFAAGR